MDAKISFVIVPHVLLRIAHLQTDVFSIVGSVMTAVYNTACVVNLHRHGNQSSQGTCCGVMLDTSGGFVLAHASCLGPFLGQGPLNLSNPTLTLEALQCFDCEVLLQRVQDDTDDKKNKRTERVAQAELNTCADEASLGRIRTSREKKNYNIKPMFKGGRTFYAYSKFPARVVDVFQCQVVAEALAKLMPDSSWELVDRKDAKQTTDGNNNNSNNSSNTSRKGAKQNVEVEADGQKLLSSFLILKLQEWIPYRSLLNIWPTRECCVGDRVEICSTPFGGLKPDAFMNSFSRGIISNMAGKDNCLLLTDARCILGGEGSPLYTFQKGVETAR